MRNSRHDLNNACNSFNIEAKHKHVYLHAHNSIRRYDQWRVHVLPTALLLADMLATMIGSSANSCGVATDMANMFRCVHPMAHFVATQYIRICKQPAYCYCPATFGWLRVTASPDIVFEHVTLQILHTSEVVNTSEKCL
jgi:hypothetical protein